MSPWVTVYRASSDALPVSPFGRHGRPTRFRYRLTGSACSASCCTLAAGSFESCERVVAVGPPPQAKFLTFFLGAVRATVPGFTGLPTDLPPLLFQVADPGRSARALRRHPRDGAAHPR